jgi:hypothetical protein
VWQSDVPPTLAGPYYGLREWQVPVHGRQSATWKISLSFPPIPPAIHLFPSHDPLNNLALLLFCHWHTLSVSHITCIQTATYLLPRAPLEHCPILSPYILAPRNLHPLQWPSHTYPPRPTCPTEHLPLSHKQSPHRQRTGLIRLVKTPPVPSKPRRQCPSTGQGRTHTTASESIVMQQHQ